MALNSSKDAIIDNRRLMVAQLRLRGLTQREIESQLANNPQSWNPRTNKPWSLGIINRDIKALEDEWKAEAAKETNEFKARQLAEIEAARRQAWKEKNLSEIRQLIKLEMQLTGTESAQKIAGADGENLTIKITYADN